MQHIGNRKKNYYITDMSATYRFFLRLSYSYNILVFLYLGCTHKLVTLKAHIAKLIEVVNEKKVWIFDKEECLLGMSKQLATIICDWDTQTDQMVQQLHEARDKQVVCK